MGFSIWILLIAAIPFMTALLPLLTRGNEDAVRIGFTLSGIALPAVTLSGIYVFFAEAAGADAVPFFAEAPWPALAIAGACAVGALLPSGGHKSRTALFAAFCAIILFLFAYRALQTPAADIVWQADENAFFPLSFRLDGMTAVFLAMVSLLWLPALLYASEYMSRNGEKARPRFFFFYALAVCFALMLGLAGNGLTLFLFYELLSLSTFPLVTHKRDDESRKRGRVYLGVLLFGSLALMLPGMALFYAEAGTLAFTPGGHALKDASPLFVLGVTALLVFGASKAALMPLHRWLPSAMVAPTPVSALLHAVAVVKAGVFTVIKCVFLLIGSDNLAAAVEGAGLPFNPLLYVAGITLVTASCIALFQTHLKKLLAYSTIGQLSYIVMAALLAAPKAVTASLMHMTAHGFAKITLFFAAGAFYTVLKKTRTYELNGAARFAPYTSAAFAAGALSMIGLPPLAGFWGKWHIFSAAFQAGEYLPFAVLTISTILNAAYFLPLVYRMYFASPRDNDGNPLIDLPETKEPVLMRFALIFTATLAVMLFFYPETVRTPAAGPDRAVSAEENPSS